VPKLEHFGYIFAYRDVLSLILHNFLEASTDLLLVLLFLLFWQGKQREPNWQELLDDHMSLFGRHK
jgi:hypothetical protein